MEPAEFDQEKYQAKLDKLGAPKIPEHDRRQFQNKSTEADRVIKNLDPINSTAQIAGLLTCPEVASNAHRLEKMIEDVLCNANGKKRLNTNQLIQLFKIFGDLGHGSMEDPAEDVFVSLVYFRGQNFRIFEGLWEASAFHLQRFLNAIESMPDKQPFILLKDEVKSMLILSEAVAERRGLTRYSCGEEYPVPRLQPEVASQASELSKAVLFTNAELAQLGVKPDDIIAFSTSVQLLRKTRQEEGRSDLFLKPLVRYSSGVLIAVPANISTAIRFRVIMFADQYGMKSMLGSRLALEYTDLIKGTPILGESFGAPLLWRFDNPIVTGEVIKEVDSGRFIHFLFLLDDFEQFNYHNFTSVSPSFDNAGDLCQSCLDAAMSRAASQPNYKEGITIVVGCGWGRGIAIPAFETGRDDWRIEVTSIEQLVTLSWSKGMQPLHMFRLLDHVRELERRNVLIRNANGLLNLFEFVSSQGFHLAPHSALEPDMVKDGGPLMLSIPLNSIFDMRRCVAQLHDLHLATPPESMPVLVRRYHIGSYFSSEFDLPLYGSITDIALGTLKSVYEGAWMSVWLTSHTADPEDRDGLFRFWDAATKWIATIVPALESAIGISSMTEIAWHIEYETTSDPADLNIDQPESADQLFSKIETRVNISKKSITSYLPRSVYIGFHQPKNSAEQAILMSLVDGVNQILNTDLDPIQTAKQAVGSEYARHFHLFEAREFADFVADKIPRHPILFEPFDDTLSRLGIAFRVKGLSPGDVIDGVKRCTSTLNQVVDSLWEDVRKLLKRLDRKSTIEKLMLNTMATHRSNQQWQRTIRAVLALQDGKDNTLRTAADHIFRNNIASSASRYAIEMAICECPESDGEMPGEFELSRLIALIQLICQYGGWSDGIQCEVITDRIEVSTLGLLHISSDFHDGILEPYGFGTESIRLQSYSDSYENMFEQDIRSDPIAETVGAEFPEIWKEEFGFDIDEARKFLDELDDQALQEHSPVVCWKRSRYFQLAAKSMSEDSSNRFINELIIRHRASWDIPSEGYTDKDIVPWRFKRRLSLVYRPIVQLTNSDESLCICSPELVRIGLALRLSRAFNGEFEDQIFTSQRMRAWAGSRRNQLGHKFTKSMAALLRKDGWKVKLERELPEILGRKLERDYGDVDILAWNPKLSRTLVIECKNLFVAKTPGEVARQLVEFRGQVDNRGKPDRLLRHLQRVNLLCDNQQALARFVGMEETTIESVLLFQNRVPIEFIEDDAIAQVKICYPDTLLDA
tara:strand:+ start:18078 stop:21854 length:3777 start_codon:yes stop_codon:yes gene_type:complete